MIKHVIVILAFGFIVTNCSSPQRCHADNMLTLDWWQNCIEGVSIGNHTWNW